MEEEIKYNSLDTSWDCKGSRCKNLIIYMTIK